MTARVLVAGVGNLFLGDDGFGPEVVRRLAGTALPPGVRAVDYGIRGMHLAYDVLDGYDALILVDALPAQDRPGTVTVLHIDEVPNGDFDPHGMNPTAVLSTVERLGGALPPTYVVGCAAATLDEGIGLSEPVGAAVPVAVHTIRALLAQLGASSRQQRVVDDCLPHVAPESRGA